MPLDGRRNAFKILLVKNKGNISLEGTDVAA
jgi:hypothetical protein